MQELPGLYFMRARYYSADAAVFLSTDPVKGIGPGWHPSMFLYASGNPIGGIDPEGLVTTSLKADFEIFSPGGGASFTVGPGVSVDETGSRAFEISGGGTLETGIGLGAHFDFVHLSAGNTVGEPGAAEVVAEFKACAHLGVGGCVQWSPFTGFGGSFGLGLDAKLTGGGGIEVTRKWALAPVAKSTSNRGIEKASNLPASG